MKTPPRPVAGAGEVLVRVRAAGVNPVDVSGRRFPLPDITGGKPMPIILGWDAAGEVVAVGEGVTRFAVGDEVFGMPRFPELAGAYSQYLTSPVTDLALKPQQLSFQEAAALPLAGLTAWQGLFELGNLQPGQSIFISGGSGGVGHLAVQYARWKGAKVYTTTSERNLDFLRELGADVVIDYNRENVTDLVEGVDLAFDTIGGEVLEQSFKVVRRGGTVVSTPLQKGIIEQGQKLAPDYGVNFRFTNVHTSGEQLTEIARVVEADQLKPQLEAVFSLEHVAEAQNLAEQGHVRGKVVLAVE